MAEWNALLPKAPDAGTNILADPAKALGLVGQINQIQLFNQIYRAREGIGQAYKENVGPDGTVNEPGLRAAVAQRGGFLAPDTMSTVQTQEGQRVGIGTSRIQQGELSRGIYNTVVGSLNPNATPEEFARNLATASRHFDPRVLPSGMINDAIQSFKRAKPEDRARMITDAQRGSIGAADLSQTQEVLGPGGSRELKPRGEVIEQTAPVGGPRPFVPGGSSYRGVPTAVAPAEATVMAESGKQSAVLRSTAATMPQMEADLSNLRHDSRILGDFGGPTAEVEKRLNSLALRVGVPDGFTMSRGKVAAAESFTKIAEQIAAQQQKQMSDAGLHNAQASNPSLQMSQLGRENVIGMLQGNTDAIKRTRQEWANARQKGGWRDDQYADWMQQFGDKFDVRVFQFNRMDREGQKKFFAALPPGEAQDFKKKYIAAAGTGWVDPLTPASNASKLGEKDSVVDQMAKILQGVEINPQQWKAFLANTKPSENIEDRRQYDPTQTPSETVDINTPYLWQWMGNMTGKQRKDLNDRLEEIAKRRRGE